MEDLKTRIEGYSDEHLLKMVTSEREDYQQFALELAEAELRKRGLTFERPQRKSYTKRELIQEIQRRLAAGEDLASVKLEVESMGHTWPELTEDESEDDLPVSVRSAEQKSKWTRPLWGGLFLFGLGTFIAGIKQQEVALFFVGGIAIVFGVVVLIAERLI